LRPAAGRPGRAVLEWLISRVSELEFREHDPEGFAMWISTRPRPAALPVLLQGSSGPCTGCQVPRVRSAGRRPGSGRDRPGEGHRLARRAPLPLRVCAHQDLSYTRQPGRHERLLRRCRHGDDCRRGSPQAVTELPSDMRQEPPICAPVPVGWLAVRAAPEQAIMWPEGEPIEDHPT
jgi:hypothetical protein